MSHNPKWLPFLPDGRAWEFVSYKGRWLGGVARAYHGCFIATKFCCGGMREFPFMSDAARYVETTLHCTECKRSCLAPASN